MRMLIRNSDKDPWLSVHVHPECPSPPIAGLQNYATSSSWQSHNTGITRQLPNWNVIEYQYRTESPQELDVKRNLLLTQPQK